MTEVLFMLPSYVHEIVALVSKRNWVIHNFNTDNDSDIYNPGNYLHNAEFSNTRYTVVLDLNVYQFLVNCTKKDQPSDNYRDAVALLVFCQIANIEVDPTYAVYEKVNYDLSNLSEAISDLELFHNINNFNMDKLAKYALGFSDGLDFIGRVSLDRNEFSEELMRYKRLTEWDSLYLIMLSIVDIKYDAAISTEKKIPQFINWLIRDFRLSLVSVVYAIFLFGNRLLKRMMKFKVAHNLEERRRAVFNMTWDLYLMRQFFKIWTSKEETQETLFVSDDKAFCSLLKSAVEIQKSENFESIRPYLSQSNYAVVQQLIKINEQKPKRVYMSEAWGPDYRSKLIKQYEEKLF